MLNRVAVCSQVMQRKVRDRPLRGLPSGIMRGQQVIALGNRLEFAFGVFTIRDTATECIGRPQRLATFGTPVKFYLGP